MTVGEAIPLAVDNNGKYFTPNDIKSPYYTPRQLKCPSCLTDVIPRVNGRIRVAHFAHKSSQECHGGGGEGIIHKMAKEMIASCIHDYTFINTCVLCEEVNNHVFENVTCTVEMIMGKFVIDVGIMDASGEKHGAIEIRDTHAIGDFKNGFLCKKLEDRVFEVDAHKVLKGELVLHSRLQCSRCNPYKGSVEEKKKYTSKISNSSAVMEDARDRVLFVKQEFAPGKKSVLSGTAGSGKTTLIKEMIKNNPDKRFLFTCFNKSLQLETIDRFRTEGVTNVDVSTFDSIWYKMYHKHIRTGRLKPDWGFKYLDELNKYLDGYSEIDSFDREVSKWMRKILDDDTWWTFKRMTRDIYDSNGPFIQDMISEYDVLICDEAQDMQPMTSRIISEMFNKYTHVVYAGDPCQQLYAFTGAIDSMSNIIPDNVFTLHKTFRFGADACRLLNESGVNYYTTFPGLSDNTTPVVRYSQFSLYNKESYTYLFRSVCCMVKDAECLSRSGTRVSLDFEKRIGEIKKEKKQMELYKKQGKKIYIDNKTQAWIEKLDNANIDQLRDLFSKMIPVEGETYIEFSTVHKYKGMESDVVRVAEDVIIDPDLNIINVAISRARNLLVLP